MVSLHSRFRTHRFAGPAIAVGGLIFSVAIMAVVLSQGRYVHSWWEVLAIHVFLMHVQSQRISPSDTCRRDDRDSWVSGQDL